MKRRGLTSLLLWAAALIALAPMAHASAPLLVGDSGVEATSAALGSGQAEAVRFTAAATGIGGSESIYIVGYQNAATKVTVGVYSDSAGLPGTLLASGSATPTPDTWDVISIGKTSLTAGTTYWLALLGTGGQLGTRDSYGGCTARLQSHLSTLPAEWSGTASRSECVSVYVTGASTPPPPVPPFNTGLPSTSGTPQQGDVLTASPGTWSGDSPVTFAYTWSGDTTGQTDTLSSADVGTTVTATNDAGFAQATSQPVGPFSPPTPTSPPRNVNPPTITGMPQQDDTLTASPGAWTGTGPITYSYLWSDGATGLTDTLSVADVEQTVSVKVTASNRLGFASATSDAVGPVTAPPSLDGESLISESASTYSSGSVLWPVANMNDSTYDEYRCKPTCAGILHFTNRPNGDAEVSWYNEDNDFWAAIPFLGDPNYNLPKDFTIDGCAASCPGTPPSSGWTNLETITGNVFNGGQYVLNLGTGCGGAACAWLRMNVTGSRGSTENMDAAWHMDVAPCRSACSDAWLFVGDSITNNSMGHTPTSPPNFMQTIGVGAPGYYPSQIEAGVSYSKTCDWLGVTDGGTTCPDGSPTGSNSMISQVLTAFPSARFITLNLGTNDLNGSGSNYGDSATTQFEANVTQLVEDVINAGRVPVVPTIPWAPSSCDRSGALPDDNPTTSGTPNYWITHTLYSEFPQVIHGPDLWTYFDQHAALMSTSNCPHPTTTGQAAYRTLWANTMLSEAYP